MATVEETTFARATEPLRGALKLHCYRMLGSSHDSEDLVQETMMRAWRARESLNDPDRIKPWLYRIATNACLDELGKRPPAVYAPDVYPPSDGLNPETPNPEPPWLEPMPDAWLEGAADPAARYTIKESVALAFVAALQVLSPVQRATLLLRDVVGLSAEETAGALEMSVGAANSALFRARTSVDEKLIGRDPGSFVPAAGEVDRALLAQYVRALEDVDVGAFTALLHQEIKTTMPPFSAWVSGHAANVEFYRYRFANMIRGLLRLVPLRANGQTAFGYYRADAQGQPFTIRAVQVLAARDGKIASIDHFMTPAVFPVFGLPPVV